MLSINDIDKLDKYDFRLIKITRGDYDKKLFPNMIEAIKEFIRINYGGYENGQEVELCMVTMVLKEVVGKIGAFEKHSLLKYFYHYDEAVRFARFENKEITQEELTIEALIGYIMNSRIRDTNGELLYGLTEEIIKLDEEEELN